MVEFDARARVVDDLSSGRTETDRTLNSGKSAIIMIASRKGGHRFPAATIAEQMNSVFESRFRARVVNLLDHLPVMNLCDRLSRWGDLNLKTVWQSGYAALTNPRSLYVKLYRGSLKMLIDHPGIARKLRRIAVNIDIMVSMQPEINAVADVMKQWFSVPFHTLIMDCSAHAGWCHPDVDRYYVANRRVRRQLIGYGVSPRKIFVTGAPTQTGHDIYLRTPVDRQRRLLGINPVLPTILVMAGYLGRMVDYVGVIHSLKEHMPEIQILAVTGRNIRMHDKLVSYDFPDVFVFYDLPSIHPVMRAADLVISKPGGMVIADCLAHGKPMALISPQGGALQESLFAAMVEDLGAGCRIKTASDIGQLTRELFEDRGRLTLMAGQSWRYGELNRTAAQTIAGSIIESAGFADNPDRS